MRILLALCAFAFITGCQSANSAQDNDNVFNVFYRCSTDEYILVVEKVMENEDGRIQREFACAQHPDKDKYPSLDGKIYSKEEITSKDQEDNGVYNIFFH